MGLTQAEKDEMAALQSGTPAPASIPQPTATPSRSPDSISLSFTPTQTPAPTPAPGLTPAERAEMAELQSGAPVPAPAAAPIPAAGEKGSGEYGEVQQPPGLLGSLYETAFPSRASLNDDYEKLPDWLRAPEFRQFSKNTVLAHLGTMAAGPEETKKILQKQFPGLEIKQDGRYLLLKSPTDGQTYAWKPGVRGTDLLRGLESMGVIAGTGALASAALPALAAMIPTAGVFGGGATAAAGQALMEGLQSAAGGTFDPGQVLGAAALGAGGALAGKAARGVGAAVFGSAAPAAEAAALSAPQLAGRMSKAAGGSTAAAEDVAAQVKPDSALLAAAERQGLMPAIHPDQAATNPVYQQVSQAIPGAAERHAATADAVRQKVEQLVTNAGGDVDRSVLQSNIKAGLEKQLADNDAATKGLYGAVKAAVPPNFPTPASNLVAKIDDVIARLRPAGSDAAGKTKDVLTGELTKLRNVVAPPGGAAPTWDAMDVTAKLLGAATAGQGALKKLPPGVASELLPFMVADRLAVAESRGAGDAFLKATEAYKAQGAFEDAAVSAFGEKAANELERLDTGVKMLAAGNAARFEQVITGAPATLRPKIAASSLLSIFSKDRSPADVVRWFDGLKRNEGSAAALKQYLSPEMWEGLKDSVTVLRGVSNAMAAKAPGGKVFPESSAFVQKLFSLGVSSGVGAAAHAVGAPAWVSLPVSGFVMQQLSGAKTPALEALKDFVTSPAGRAAIEASASQAAPSAMRVARIAASASYRRFMDAAGIPASGWTLWLERALAQGASVGSQSYNQQSSAGLTPPTPYAQPQPVKE